MAAFSVTDAGMHSGTVARTDAPPGPLTGPRACLCSTHEDVSSKSDAPDIEVASWGHCENGVEASAWQDARGWLPR